MIYNDNFVWLHFPKCAGSKIEILFQNYLSQEPGLVQDVINHRDDSKIIWHDSIDDRKKRDDRFELGSRTVVCSIRRLPSWLESRYNFEFKRSPKLKHDPEMVLTANFFESSGYKNSADYYVKKYLPESVINTCRVKFLRTEFFEDDFKKIFGEYLDISTIPDEEYSVKSNVSSSYLPADVKEKLYADPDKLYAYAPYWKKIEQLAY